MDTKDRVYRTRQSRIYNHLGWYLKETFKGNLSDKLTISKIQTTLAGLSGIKLRKRTILLYNTRQFAQYHTAPLERVTDDTYKLNENYYRMLEEKVFAPRVGRPGRPRKKYTQGDEELDATR